MYSTYLVNLYAVNCIVFFHDVACLLFDFQRPLPNQATPSLVFKRQSVVIQWSSSRHRVPIQPSSTHKITIKTFSSSFSSLSYSLLFVSSQTIHQCSFQKLQIEFCILHQFTRSPPERCREHSSEHQILKVTHLLLEYV